MMHITIEKEKLEQWLEDLEYSDSDKNVIAAIKQALAAQPAVQEPVSPEDHLMGEAHKYWKHANARHHGAVQWIENNETGELLIYTRGEYRDTLMANITNTTPPAAQHQCKWPTCQSEEYQQALAEQINQELVTGAAQPAPVQLTDEQIRWHWSNAHNDTTDRMAFEVFARAIEAAHGITKGQP
jgi:hypothetical protein